MGLTIVKKNEGSGSCDFIQRVREGLTEVKCRQRCDMGENQPQLSGTWNYTSPTRWLF